MCHLHSKHRDHDEYFRCPTLAWGAWKPSAAMTASSTKSWWLRNHRHHRDHYHHRYHCQHCHHLASKVSLAFDSGINFFDISEPYSSKRAEVGHHYHHHHHHNVFMWPSSSSSWFAGGARSDNQEARLEPAAICGLHKSLLGQVKNIPVTIIVTLSNHKFHYKVLGKPS